MDYFWIILCSALLISCAGKNEKTELKNPLEVLSGDTYGTTADPVYGSQAGVVSGVKGIPVGGARNKTTRIHGKILLGEGMTATPVKFTEVRVVDGAGKTLDKVTSDIHGKFVLSGVFFNGRYFVEIVSKKYTGKAEIFVDRYDVEVDVMARGK